MQLSYINQTIYEHLYRDIYEFRSTFDLPVEDAESLNLQLDTLHTSLIIEELTELAEADSLIEQADAIVDSVYVLMGRMVHMGVKYFNDNASISYLLDLFLAVANNLKIDFIRCWDEIHSSNMSKVCHDEREFQQTVDFYQEQGVKLSGVNKNQYIIAKCAEDIVMEGKTIRKGKVLKSVNYRPADLSKICR
ncbi:SAM-dependent methyltransferase [Parashewanella spongiae]|uniref:SAM-dependent methyltransferase n=1 Tax=Parashewanella spongiae TaxID=342950 RepID=A0A3A6TIH8_9GAMM|nr:nucleoside triphosphate pyrophosphohydrolase family protein [Parashewanella spongiae]MCL1079357.1 nucleoside triphosphate pyrophosphohydrolase family protein [Parashewanella spongiae]RJY11487.1 SAM-dependent methyltransferase [Parashewanella spongiae]